MEKSKKLRIETEKKERGEKHTEGYKKKKR